MPLIRNSLKHKPIGGWHQSVIHKREREEIKKVYSCRFALSFSPRLKLLFGSWWAVLVGVVIRNKGLRFLFVSSPGLSVIISLPLSSLADLHSSKVKGCSLYSIFMHSCFPLNWPRMKPSALLFSLFVSQSEIPPIIPSPHPFFSQTWFLMFTCVFGWYLPSSSTLWSYLCNVHDSVRLLTNNSYFQQPIKVNKHFNYKLLWLQFAGRDWGNQDTIQLFERKWTSAKKIFLIPLLLVLSVRLTPMLQATFSVNKLLSLIVFCTWKF